MATLIATTQVTRAGVKMAPVTGIVAGHKFKNDGRIIMKVSNTSAGPLVLTIVTPRTEDGMAVADRTVSIPATDYKMIGPFPPEVYNQPGGADDGMVNVTYATAADMTIELYRLD